MLTKIADRLFNQCPCLLARTLGAEQRDKGLLACGRILAQRLTGGVLITRGGETARGDVAIYDFDRRIITMAGNVALRRGGDTLNGGRLVIDLASGVSSVDGRAGGSSSGLGTPGSGGGRVSGSFSVPKRSN